MSTVTFKGQQVQVKGTFPKKGDVAPNFILTKTDLSDVSLANYKGKRKILNIFPSIDTGVCAASVHHFNKDAANLLNTIVLCISADLPFAQARFCGAEGIDHVETLSTFRHPDFKDTYGVNLTEGPLSGLCARGVVVIDENDKVIYSQLVDEIAHEPDYQAALAVL